MASAVLVGAIALLVLAQGGFFPLATCVLGAVVCVAAVVAWFRRPCRNRDLPIVALLFLGVALAYAISAFVNGLSLTTLSETGVWAACAGVSFLSAAQSGEKRAFWVKVFAWFGIATAVAGVLVCSGVLPLAGGMVEERLQFTFQYANAAAAWYGVCTFLCLLSPDERQRAFAALPAAALLLTESGGGLIVFVVCAAIVGIRWARAAAWDRLFQALLQGVVAVLVFVVVRLTLSPVALIALAAALAACWWLGKGAAGLVGRVNTRMASLVMVGVFVIGAIAAVFILSGRVADALASVNERMYHARDGLSMWLSKPLLGVGPDNWQYLYPYIQTAPYYTTVVHCSYVQLMLDAGIVGLAFFVAAVVFGLRELLRDAKDAAARGGWAQAELIVVVFLLVHALLDFDFQFASLAFVLAAMLAAPSALNAGNASDSGSGSAAESASNAKAVSQAESAPDAKVVSKTEKASKAGKASKEEKAANAGSASRAPKGVVAGIACLIVCLPACLTGALCSATATSFELAEASGDYAACERLFLGNPLAQADVSAQSHYLTACYNQGKYDEVENIYHFMPAPTDSAVYYTAMAYYARNDQVQATSVLIKHLEEQPYNVDFLNGVVQLTETYGIDPAQSARYAVAADRVRSNASENHA